MIILKVGGSAISNKITGESHISEVADILCEELPKDEKLIIVVGAGYIGHKIAKENLLFKIDNNQNKWALLRYKVNENAQYLIGKLIDAGYAPIEMSTSSLLKLNNNSIESFDYKLVESYANLGFIPVLHSDAPINISGGISILSGDVIASELALKLNADLLIFGTDVDGIINKQKLISKISKSDAMKIEYWDNKDLTGGMKNKIIEVKRLKNTAIRIINIRKKGMLSNAIKRLEVGTLIE